MLTRGLCAGKRAICEEYEGAELERETTQWVFNNAGDDGGDRIEFFSKEANYPICVRR